MTAQFAKTQRRATLLRHGAPPLVIGHRGNSAMAPENTLEAFHACWAAGVQWVETDVQPSADLVPVLFHDETLNRTSNGDGALRERPLIELAAFDAGSWFTAGSKKLPRPIRIPTLHSLLGSLPATGQVLLEIKGPHSPAELVAELAVIRATGTWSQVWLQSFHRDVLRELADAMPDGWRGILRDEIDADPVALCRDLRLSSYNPECQALLASPEVIDDLHAAGISVITFTTNEPREWAALTDLGVDGIITDRPAELLAWQRAA